jgi:hypothetical protein
MKRIEFTVNVDGALAEAQARVLGSIDTVLRARGLGQHPKADGAEYRPRFVGLVVVWAVRRLQNEHVTVSFEHRGSTTEVRVTGRLRDRAYTELTEALGGSYPSCWSVKLGTPWGNAPVRSQPGRVSGFNQSGCPQAPEPKQSEASVNLKLSLASRCAPDAPLMTSTVPPDMH